MKNPTVTTTIGDEPFKNVDINYEKPKVELTVEQLTKELISLKNFVNNDVINTINQMTNNINVLHERLLYLESKNA